MTRRDLLAATAVSALAQNAEDDLMGPVVSRYDKSVERTLQLQDTDPKSRWRGTYPDEYGLHYVAVAGGVIDTLVSAYLQPRSKYYNDAALVPRVKLAADLLLREMSPDGNIDNPITNFNSPADTAFLVRGMCPSFSLARRAGKLTIVSAVEPVLRRAAAGLVKGGIHTPNHRWVLSAALSQLYELFGDQAYVRRIDQWLAEGIDIDSDGQYSERSTYVYNPITNAAFVTMAAKLKRPQLLEPVKRNLESMLYLLHPGYEVVTEISRRQDLNQRGDMGSYWFSLAYLAAHTGDGRFATIARHFWAARASLSALMEYPELAQKQPALQPIPDNYRHEFPHNGVIRIRRGPVSATILTERRSRFFTLRNGQAVINGVRFASAFFGRGQFVPSKSLTQSLSGPYYQPFDPPRLISADEWDETRAGRKKTEVNVLTQSASVTEDGKRFRVRIQSQGTKNVPLAIEINFREGGRLQGVEPAHKVAEGFVLKEGYGTYRVGSDVIRFGPALHEHMYTQIRAAEPKMSGPSVYLTAFTPVDYTLEFECSSA